jgi:hypothetical protein
VDITGKCIDRWNPEMGVVPCPALKKVEPWVIFTDDEEKMAKRADVLASLGFDGDDLTRLIPGRKNSHDFKGKKCLVRPSVSAEGTYWNIAVPRAFSQPALSPEESEAIIKDLQGTFKKVKKNRKTATAGVGAEVPF